MKVENLSSAIAVLVVICLVIAFAVGGAYFSHFISVDVTSPVFERITDEGRRAYRVGVPSTANPYQGSSGASTWLNGWIDESEKAKEQRDE